MASEQPKPRRHYNTELGQMVWIPRTVYGRLRAAAAAQYRSISRQLELIITEWLRARDGEDKTS